MNLFKIIFLSLLVCEVGFAADSCRDRYPVHTWVEIDKVSEHFRGFRRQDFPRDSWNEADSQVDTLNAEKPTQLLSDCPFEDFIFSFDWYVTGKGNGGVKYQVQEKLGAVGFEYQMVDPSSQESTLSSLHKSGALYDILAPESEERTYEYGHWNHGIIVVRGHSVEHWLNGRIALSFEIGSEEFMSGVDQSKFKDRPEFRSHAAGHILLQHHGERVSYRNMRIQRLK